MGHLIDFDKYKRSKEEKERKEYIHSCIKNSSHDITPLSDSYYMINEIYLDELDEKEEKDVKYYVDLLEEKRKDTRRNSLSGRFKIGDVVYFDDSFCVLEGKIVEIGFLKDDEVFYGIEDDKGVFYDCVREKSVLGKVDN